MGLSRRLKRPSIPFEDVDRLIVETGSEYRGGLVKNNGLRLTRLQLTVYDCIKKNDGIWYAELRRLFGAGGIHSVEKLMRLGLVYSRKDGIYTRYYDARGVVGEEKR
jgi:hypothetical protein